VVHAAGESSRLSLELHPNTHAVALGAPSEAALLELEARLRFADIAHVAVREPDAPYGGQLMAIGLAPQPRTSKLKKVMSAFQLLS
jgi:hypothetical protein